MKVGIPKETFPGERRVAMAPAVLPALAKIGITAVVESSAGEAAGWPDAEYKEKGAEISTSREEVFQADCILQVRSLGANPEQGRADLALMRPGQVIIAMCDPLGAPQAVQEIAETGATLFALEMIPRITRAQSMDVLSSMATIAGYRAVLLGRFGLAEDVPHAHLRRRHAAARQGVRDWHWRGRLTGHRHGQGPGRERAGPRHSAYQ